MKAFLKMIKYEIIRITRNKVVLSMLLIFSILMIVMVSFMQGAETSFPIAMYTDGIEISESSVVSFITENVGVSDIYIVKSEQDGINLVKSNDVCFFICLDAGENKEETTAVFYYDQTNVVSRNLRGSLAEANNERAYQSLIEFLKTNGITLRESYFNSVSFKTINDKELTIQQMPYIIEIATCISVVLMFGLAYSMARDNESNISKNLSYLPVGTNKYLLSKILPYFLLGFIQLSLLYLIGIFPLKIHFEINFFIVLALSSVFIASVVNLSVIFSMLKSQIATAFLDMIAIMLPIFIELTMYIKASPVILQIILNFFPVIPFVSSVNAMIFNGVIKWLDIAILLVQTIVYYVLSVIILKRKVKN